MSTAPGGELPGLPLTPELASEIEPLLARMRAPLGERTPSDGTFSNLYLFRNTHRYRYRAGPWPCIVGHAYDGAQILIPLFDLTMAPMEVLRDLQGRDGWFFPIADAVLGGLDSGAFESKSLRDDADYLYAAESFVDYQGPGLGSKRHSIERLLDTTRLEARPLDAGGRAAALAVLEGWCLDKGRGLDEADCAACCQALAMLGPGSSLRGFLHEANGVPAGFVLVEELNPGVLAVRFAKGRVRFEGIYAHLFQDLARRLAPGVRWLNFEQDLGKSNFRRTKLSFRPAALLAKHRVRFA